LPIFTILVSLKVGAAQQPTVWDAPPAAKKMKNRVSLTGEKVEAVAKLYDRKCAACHGAKGASNGPAAASLAEAPANFTNAKAMAKVKDGELFWKITTGRSPMPGYGAELPETDRWQLVNYVRDLTRRSEYRISVLPEAAEARRGTREN
jgi:mono/diheme cytochrome c family protein